MKRTLLISSLLLIGAACRAEPAAERAYAQLNSRLVAAKSLTGTLNLDQVGRKTAYTFRFLRPNSPKDPPVTMMGTYADLRLDAPLTPRAFAWKPPAGAKKLDYTADLLKVGSPAPAFTLKTPEGAGVSLASTVGKNKATLVAFWFYG